MFLFVSDRHVGAHLDGQQHGVYMQITINLGEIAAWIRILARASLHIFLPYSGLNLLNGLDFYFDLFE